ncbi:hypothetical protein RAA17_10685 [Komagataeibacter rhaeticus]|nr:hypothetical protein [Komagataeibacter rhaeticus]
MNQSSFNFGNAVGAWAGSHIVETHWSYGGLPVLSACFAFTGLGLVGLAEYYVRRQTKNPVKSCLTR